MGRRAQGATEKQKRRIVGRIPFQDRDQEKPEQAIREPREVSCLLFRAIKTPPDRERAHRPHTSAVEIKIYWDLIVGH